MTQMRFVDDDRGASAVEFAMIAPLLLLVLLGTCTIFDLFRTSIVAEKATFTIGDTLSRRSSVNAATMSEMLAVLKNIVPNPGNAGLRVSSIMQREGKTVVRWTRTTGQSVSPTSWNISSAPRLAEGQSVLVIESFVPHTVLVEGFGAGDITFRHVAIDRPRYVTEVTSE